MDNPIKDHLFSITDDAPIKRNTKDGSWLINGSNIRMNVITPKDFAPWKNIEMTGYVKITSSINQTKSIIKEDNNNEENNNIVDVDWRARGGVHMVQACARLTCGSMFCVRARPIGPRHFRAFDIPEGSKTSSPLH